MTMSWVAYETPALIDRKTSCKANDIRLLLINTSENYKILSLFSIFHINIFFFLPSGALLIVAQ